MLKPMELHEFDAVYALMQQSFPREEYRSYEGQRALLEDATYTVYLAHDKAGEVVALAAVWELGEFTLLEHLAVSPSLRCGGLGSRMLSELADTVSGRLFLEVELPENDLARRRIGFYERNGFCYNEYPYEQPPLSEDHPAVPLRIMTRGGAIDDATFAALRDTVYRHVYHCL